MAIIMVHRRNRRDKRSFTLLFISSFVCRLARRVEESFSLSDSASLGFSSDNHSHIWKFGLSHSERCGKTAARLRSRGETLLQSVVLAFELVRGVVKASLGGKMQPKQWNLWLNTGQPEPLLRLCEDFRLHG